MEEKITQGADGYYHPRSEEELQALVRKAIAASPPLKIRVRGFSALRGQVHLHRRL
jgi:hypothetical protein